MSVDEMIRELWKITNAGAKQRYTVKQRAKNYEQPVDGFLPINEMQRQKLNPSKIYVRYDLRNGIAQYVGMTVDYLTRFLITGDIKKAFEISFKGAYNAGKKLEAEELFSRINTRMDDDSIINALKLTTFDSYYRTGKVEEYNTETIADIITPLEIDAVREMVVDTVSYLRKHENIMCGVEFPGAFTETVGRGDADFVASNILFDLKCIKGYPNKIDTLQLLIYYFLAKHSTNTLLNCIDQIGIINPRRNEVYLQQISKLNPTMLCTIEKDVVGYKQDTDPHRLGQ